MRFHNLKNEMILPEYNEVFGFVLGIMCIRSVLNVVFSYMNYYTYTSAIVRIYIYNVWLSRVKVTTTRMV